jgi:hypothetical protein
MAMSPVRTPSEETKHTVIAAGCAVVYGSVFVLSGLSFIYLALTTEADPDDRMGYYFVLLMGSFFTIGGSVMLYNIRREYADLQVASELQSASPGQPWMWRSDWAAGYSVEVLREGHQQLWLWTIGWGLITAAVLWEARRGIPDVPWLRTVVAAVVLGAIVLLSKAAYRTLRTRRYGDVRLHLHANPYRPGGTVSATLKATSKLAPTGPMKVTLAYVHEYVKSSERTSFTHENILWSDTCSIETAAMKMSSGTVEVPIHFKLPFDADPTDDAIPSNRHYWRIDAEARVKGIDFHARFEIPVWR